MADTRPLLVSVDVYRPGSARATKSWRRDQGQTSTKASRRSEYRDVERLAKEARREAINTGCDVLIVDTAGRLHHR